MEEKSTKKKNWIELDSDDEEEVEEKKEQDKEIETNNKQPQVNDHVSQKESDNKDNQNGSSTNNEDFGYINEKRRGHMRDRDNNNNNSNNHSRQSDQQFSRKNDERRNNNNNHNREGKNDRKEKFASIHSQNCTEILEQLEKEHQGDTVWINCFQLGQNQAIDKEELQNAFFPGINFIKFESEKDKQEQYMADINISVEDAKKISPDQPPMYKGMYFKIRYGAKNQRGNKNNNERRGGRQQSNRNDDERHDNNNQAREPAFNMKRNENNVGKVDQKEKSDVQGKKKDFFVEKQEHHDRPQIINSKKKTEEELKKKVEEEQQLKSQNAGQVESETAHDSHKGTGNTHYGEKDSLESDKIETQQLKPDQEGATNLLKETKEEKVHNQTGDKQQNKQSYQKNSERQQRDKRERGSNKQVDGSQNESNPRGQRKEEQKNNNKESENKDKNNGTDKNNKNNNDNNNANNSNKGKKPNKQTVWVQKVKGNEATDAGDGFTVVKGSQKAAVETPSKVQTATVVKNNINSHNIFAQK